MFSLNDSLWSEFYMSVLSAHEPCARKCWAVSSCLVRCSSVECHPYAACSNLCTSVGNCRTKCGTVYCGGRKGNIIPIAPDPISRRS